MHLSRAALLAALLAAVTLPAAAPDGNEKGLKETLKVRDVQGGFAGFTGRQVTIEPDGTWDESSVRGDRLKSLRTGKLSNEALSRLAAEVGKYAPAALKGAGKPTVNPRVITVTYGKNEAVLNLPAGGKLPQVDAKTPEGRFAGIVSAVQAAVPKAKGKGKKKKGGED